MPTLTKIKKKRIFWTPSTDTSTVSQSVYVKFGTELTADDEPVLTGLAPDVQEVFAPDDFPEGTFDQEGTYVIGIAAVDDMGNEAMIWDPFPFDFVAPQPPSGLGVS